MPSAMITACDTDALLACQQGTASPAQRDWLESHLNTCQPCRTALDADAAEPEFWQAASEALSSDASESTEYSIDTRELSNKDWLSNLKNFEFTVDAQKSQRSQRQVLENLLKGRLLPADNPVMLGRLGRYDIECIVGHGGMGLVLKAFDHDLGRDVAIKTMLLDRADDISARQRLLREAKTIASLHHPNIIQIHNVELWEDLPLVVMPYVAGGTLQQLGTCDTLSIDNILLIARQLAAALVTAHQVGVIHRDIKPSNILLQRGAEDILLSDFGLARIGGDHTVTLTGDIAGTPQFMSPEQAQGQQLSDRTDIFSLGSLMYWMCTKSHPFDAETPYAILLKLVKDAPSSIRILNPEVPACVIALIERLMAKEPANRPDAATTLAWIDECIAACKTPQANQCLSFMSVPAKGTSISRALLIASVVVFIIASICVWQAWQSELRPIAENSSGAVSQSAEQADTQPASLISEEPATASEPDANLRYGALDTIDVSNMLDDLNSDQNVLYWLRRLAYLPANDIPPKCITNIEELSRSSNTAVRELALVILRKNPFEEITPYQASESVQTDENPFVEIDPSELNPKN